VGEALTKLEREFVEETIRWDSRRRPVDLWFCYMALLVACLVIVAGIILTLRNLTEATVYTVLVPTIVVGLFLVGVYAVQGGRIKERHRFALILRKALGGPK
jgi:hypothetical protein